MDRTREFLRQHAVDRAATVDAGLSGELRGADFDPKMRLAALAMPGMAAMLRALVDHREMRRLKGGLELLLDPLFDCAHNATDQLSVTQA